MPGQVRHGKDGGVCAGYTATTGASYWAGTLGERHLGRVLGKAFWLVIFRKGIFVSAT